MHRVVAQALPCALLALALSPSAPVSASVLSEQKISAVEGGIAGTLADGDQFGSAAITVGDIDGDGVDDLAVGAPIDGVGGSATGAVWILFLRADGTLKNENKISATHGGLAGPLTAGDQLGFALAPLGDLDGNGVPDLAVGANLAQSVGSDRGAVWILFLESNGTVLAEQRIDDANGGFTGVLGDSDRFGEALAALGDLDGDLVMDLIVGAPGDDDGPGDAGAVWVLFLNSNGTVKAHQKISATSGSFAGALAGGDAFGSSLAPLGDLDGDLFEDVVVGAPLDADGGPARGALWVLFLNSNGTVKGHQKISDTAGGFAGTLSDGDELGGAVGAIGLLDADSTVDLVVGARHDDDGGPSRGAAWAMFLNPNGTVKGHQKISSLTGGFGGPLEDDDRFAGAVAGAGDLDGDGTLDVAVGAPRDDDGGAERGALYLLELDTSGVVVAETKLSASEGEFSEELYGAFGGDVTPLGDVDGDGIPDLAVGARITAYTNLADGAVWILFMNPDHTVKLDQRIGNGDGNFTGSVAPSGQFGHGVAGLGDLDGDGVPDLAVGNPYASIEGGVVWILFLNRDGTVKAHQKIDAATGGFDGAVASGDGLGIALARLDDLDGDGVPELAVGASGGGLPTRAAVWILFLRRDGTVKGHQRIGQGYGGFTDVLASNDLFGFGLASPGDVDGDGLPDLAVGAGNHDDGGTDKGAVWVLFLKPDGSVRSQQKISDTAGGLGPGLNNYDRFGIALGPVGDFLGDGVPDLGVGIEYRNDGGFERGALWILNLDTDGTVLSRREISDLHGNFQGTLEDQDHFGSAVSWVGDLDGDSRVEIAVGAVGEDDGRSNAGALWVLGPDRELTSCGDGLVAFGLEQCDDGGTASGDGCAADCRSEDVLRVRGTAGGGSVTATIGDVEVVVPTTVGDTASEVASALADQMNASLELQERDVTALAMTDRVYLTSPIFAVSATDPDLLLLLGEQPVGTLAAFYAFEGDTNDAICGRDITTLIGASLTSGYEGQAYDFDGVDDRAEIPLDVSPSLRPQLTMGAWARPDVVDDLRRAVISGDDGGWDRMIGTDDSQWMSFVGTGRYQSDVAPSIGQWTFVASVYDQAAGSLRFHVGDEIYTSSTGFGDGNPTLWLAGNPYLGGVEYFDGSIDNVFVFETALSPEQVGDLRRWGSAAFDAIVADTPAGQPYCREKVSQTQGGFTGPLTDYDEFGRGFEALNDLDGDGIPDAVVGAPVADGGGAVWITLLNDDGTVKAEQKIGAGAGGLTGPLDFQDLFGQGIGVFPDLDGDTVPDLAVGSFWDDDLGDAAGTVYLLRLNAPSGTVKSESKIFATGVAAGDWFGHAVEVIGDLDGDGLPELAVSAPRDDDGGPFGDENRGAVYILSMDSTGAIVAEQKISDTEGGFTGTLANDDSLGSDLAYLGDLDGDGVGDLAVGAHLDDTGGNNRGAIWVLFLNVDGTVKSHQKIGSGIGGFTATLDDDDHLGIALSRVGDLDGDGVVDLAVGARKDDDGGTNRGSAYLLFLNTTGTVKSHVKLSDAENAFGGRLDDHDWLGHGLVSPGDLDGDGVDDLLIGAARDDDGGTLELGAYWALQLSGSAASCGDGVLAALEQCDDGNADETDGCSSGCTIIPVPEPTGLAGLVAGIALLCALPRRLHSIGRTGCVSGTTSDHR